MFRYIVFIILFLHLIPALAVQAETSEHKLQVVVTIPVLADFVRNIGENIVSVNSIISGLENPHTYEPKGSDVKSLAKAGLFVQVGLGLETWSDKLVRNSGNPQLIQVTASRNCAVINNNPHVWMDIDNARKMVAAITDAMTRADPVHSGEFRQNSGRYDKQLLKLDQMIKRDLSSFSGRAIITAVPAFSYFLRHYGIEEAATIITLPGKEPSGRHIRDIITLMRKRRIKVILTVPQFSPRLPDMIAEETGAVVIEATQLPGSLPGTETYISMLKEDARKIVDAIGEENRSQ